jgi:glycerol dehydrogenase-like iron-containing ADH family enzyme
MVEDVVEVRRVATFFARVGLPICLDQVGLTAQSPELDALIEGALGLAFIHNMPGTVDESVVREAVLKADALGRTH